MATEKRAKSVGNEENRYQKLITLIGEFGDDKLPMHIEKLKGEIIESEAIHKDFLTKLLVECISWIPNKQQIYACVLLRVHEENPMFTRELLDYSINFCRDLLLQGSLHRLKLLLRFYCSLTKLNYLPLEALTSFISQLSLVSTTEPSEFFISLLADVFFHCGGIFPKPFIESCLANRKPKDLTFKSPLQLFPNQTSDLLDYYILSIGLLLTSGWPADTVLTLIPQCPEPINFSFPPDFFSLSTPKYYSPLVLDIFGLASFPVEFVRGSALVAENITSFKHNLELIVQKIEGRTVDVLINTIVAEMLGLGFMEESPVFYSCLAVKVGKQNPAFEVRLVEGMEVLLFDVDMMHITAVERLVVFLAQYINNMSFCWNWNLFLQRALTPGQELFLKKLLAKLVRLSYHDMVKSELPEPLFPYLIPEPEPILRFTEIEESVDNTDSQLIIDRINSKAPTQAMKALLTSKEICNSGDLLMMIFCESLFFQGAKSLQHITIYLERYMDILTGVSANRLLSSLFNVWAKSPQRIELLVGKLIGNKLVSSEELALFCLERLGKPDSWSDKYSLEWDLLEIAVNEARGEKFELIELVCKGCSAMAETHYEKLLNFLRSNLRYLEEMHLVALVGILSEKITRVLKNLSVLFTSKLVN